MYFNEVTIHAAHFKKKKKNTRCLKPSVRKADDTTLQKRALQNIN